MATAVHSHNSRDLTSGASAQSSGQVPFGSADFPLLPLGQLLWTDAAANVLDLAEVAPRLPDCLITLTGAGRQAAVLVAGGAIVDAVFVDRSGGRLGDDAVQAVLASTAGTVSGYAIEDQRLVAAIPLLWRYPRPVRDLPAEWLDADRLLRSIRAERRSCALLLDSPVQAAALFASGDLVASYTEKRRRPSSTTATLRALLRVPGTRITVIAETDSIVTGAGSPDEDSPAASAAAEPETPVAPLPTAEPREETPTLVAVEAEPALATSPAFEPEAEAAPEVAAPEEPIIALQAAVPETTVADAEVDVEEPEAAAEDPQMEAATPEPEIEEPQAEVEEAETEIGPAEATFTEDGTGQVTAFDDFAVLDQEPSTDPESAETVDTAAADPSPAIDDAPELPFTTLAEAAPAAPGDSAEAVAESALSTPAPPPMPESAPPAPDAPPSANHLAADAASFGPPAHHLPAYVPPTFAGDHLATNGSSNGSSATSNGANGIAPAADGEANGARRSPTDFLTEADDLDAVVSDRVLERFPADVFSLPEMTAITAAPESSVPAADAPPMTADDAPPETEEREIYRAAPPPPPAPEADGDAEDAPASTEQDGFHLDGELPVDAEHELAAPDTAPLPSMPFDDGLTFHSIPPPASTATVDEHLAFAAPAAHREVAATDPEVPAAANSSSADHIPAVVSDPALASDHTLPDEADDFVPARLDIDIDGLRTELIDIATVWLGADDIAPVAELIQRARPGVDEFVATIAAIGALQIAGHEAAVVRAMAREMHFRAAEVLCGV